MNTLPAFLMILLFSFEARADVPTPLEDCEMSRWSLCRLETGGLTRLQGPCPAGSETLKPHEPTKDCSAAAIAIEIKAREQKAEEQRAKRDKEMQSLAPGPQSPAIDMAKAPRTEYIPFAVLFGIGLLVAGLSVRRRIRRGESPIAVFVRMAVMSVATLGTGLVAGYWTLLVVTKKVGNTDGPAAGVLGLLAAVVAFAVFGPIGGYCARAVLNRLHGRPARK